MATRLERGIRIVELLRTGVPRTVADLAALMGVTRRTIFRDIALLREMNISIVMDPETSAYRCEGDHPQLFIRALAGGDRPPVQEPQRSIDDAVVKFLQTAILQGRCVLMREIDQRQQNSYSSVVPLELTLDAKGWRLVVRVIQVADGRVAAPVVGTSVPVSTSSLGPATIPATSSAAASGGATRVVLLDQVRFGPLGAEVSR